MTATATVKDASNATVTALEMEVTLPEGLELSGGPSTADPARDVTTAARDELEELTAPAEREPVDRSRPTSPETDRERQLRAARDEERNKRKRLAERFKTVEAERDELRAKSMQGPAPRTPRALVPETKEQKQARIKKLREAAEQKDLIGDVVELVAGELLDLVDKRLETLDTNVTQTFDTTKAIVDERIFRALHEDYDEVLTKAGIFDALAVQHTPQGPIFKDPIIAKHVYGQHNFAKAAYELAQSKLAHDAEKAEAGGTTDAERREAADATAGTRERHDTSTTTATTTTHGRGIRNLPGSSGPRRAAITKEFLDDLMDRDFAKYEALMKANPHLERFHLSD